MKSYVIINVTFREVANAWCTWPTSTQSSVLFVCSLTGC